MTAVTFNYKKHCKFIEHVCFTRTITFDSACCRLVNLKKRKQIFEQKTKNTGAARGRGSSIIIFDFITEVTDELIKAKQKIRIKI